MVLLEFVGLRGQSTLPLASGKVELSARSIPLGANQAKTVGRVQDSAGLKTPREAASRNEKGLRCLAVTLLSSVIYTHESWWVVLGSNQ